jgi:hypothetical protein
MSGQALARTNWHIEKLGKAHSSETAAAIQADFLKESMEHAVQHTRKYFEMLATFPHEPTQPAVEAAEAARHATAAKVGRLSQVKVTASPVVNKTNSPTGRRRAVSRGEAEPRCAIGRGSCSPRPLLMSR